MGLRLGLVCVSALMLCAGVSAQAPTRDNYEGDFIFEAEEPRPRRTLRHATEEQRRAAEAALAAFTSPALTRFSGEAEFRRYVGAVRAAERARNGWWADASRRLRFAQANTQEEVQSDAIVPLCPEDDPHCAEPDEDGQIIVTGSRINPRNPSITNNQMRNVEEGDIVKQIDHFLLILQDGRIFVVDTRWRGRRLALADRANVYRDPESDMWYDEMLVFGDRILVTGYSYDEEETELAVFRLGSMGRLVREGVFRLSSDDYYSSNNYATRLIGNSLVTYTPLSVGDMADAEFKWPIVRRWLPKKEDDEAARERRMGRPLLDAADIYRPALTLREPTIHTVSVCPLATAGNDRELACRTTAFVGPSNVQWYVTNDQVYVWTAGDGYQSYRDCEGPPGSALSATDRALLYRVPIGGAAPRLAGAYGFPPDQFAMQADSKGFHALLEMGGAWCEDGGEMGTRLSFFTVPQSSFSMTLAQAPDSAFTRLPSIPGEFVGSRFTDTHLVYGGLSNYRRGLPDPERWDEEDKDDPWVKRVLAEPTQPAYALPIARPSAVRPVDIRHSVIRAERVADDILLTGYRDRGGLIVTLIDLAGAPRIASQARLAGRYESEGRSHAFNSLIEPDGSGLMGLPTVRRVADSGREYWRSRASDLSFLRLDVDGRLEPIGELVRRFDYATESADGEEDEDGVPGYECEVSCIDWYGNSRPIFTDGRIFGLAGTELIEGRLEQGRIREVQRINIALAKAGS